MTQDFRYAVRQIRRSPGFSAIVILTLALGIGGTTAVFSLLQAVLFAPLPYEQSGQLVRLYQQVPDQPDTRSYLAGAYFSALRDRVAGFESVAAIANYSERGLDLVADGRAQRLRILRVSSDYFHTLRATLRGPGFDRGDETGTLRVVLSADIWRSAFRGDPALVGSTIRLNGQSCEVVGIAPEGFADPIAGLIDAWVPYTLARDTDPENNSLSAVGRLRAGVSVDQARAELASLTRAMRERWPFVRSIAVDAVPLKDDVVAPARGPLHLLFLAVGLVLLVACVNVANLVLARTMGRVHELAVRSALGSGSRRLVRQLLVESLVLAALGGLAGLALAALLMKGFWLLGHDAMPRLAEVRLDPVVLAFAALVTIVTAVAFGVAPTMRFAHIAPITVLRRQSRSTTGSRAQGRLRGALAAAQLALALTLLMGAGVLMASLYRLQQVPLGFRVNDVLTFEVNLPSARYDEGRRATFQEELARRVRTIAGVSAAGGISFLPATGGYHGWNVSLLSGPRAGTSVGSRDGVNIQHRTVSGDVFAALALPVLAGRTFDDRDDRRAPARVVVSANLAKAAFPDMSFDAVIGQRIAAGGRPSLEIIGVVSDVAEDVYGKATHAVYHAHSQFADNRNWALTQVVATQRPPELILGEVRGVVASLDPELIVHRAASMADVVGRGTRRERFALIVMGGFAAVSLLLSMLGLYGLLAYAVRQRTPEIGIRMALGATAGQVRMAVLRQASIILIAGLGAGAAGALLLARWLATLTFEISPSDPRILLAAALLLAITGLLAAWLPARRAARVPPTVAMQER